MSKLERHLASECIKHLGEENERVYFKRFFGYCNLMREMESPSHNEKLYGVMVDFYKWYFNTTKK